MLCIKILHDQEVQIICAVTQSFVHGVVISSSEVVSQGEESVRESFLIIIVVDIF